MSPTYYAVDMARLNSEIETARLADNITRMQRLIGEQQSLLGARPDRRCDEHLFQVSRLRRRLRG
jgi:hypothetical protein